MSQGSDNKYTEKLDLNIIIKDVGPLGIFVKIFLSKLCDHYQILISLTIYHRSSKKNGLSLGYD